MTGLAPYLGDPRWATWSAQVLYYLREPRLAANIEDWQVTDAQGQVISDWNLRNVLGYLEDVHKATTYKVALPPLKPGGEPVHHYFWGTTAVVRAMHAGTRPIPPVVVLHPRVDPRRGRKKSKTSLTAATTAEESPTP